MSEWRQIWKKAIKVNQRMGADLEKGEAEFAALLKTCPDDGMVLYSRGEGYERRCLWSQAIKDYRGAEQHMPVPHWKAVARLAADRVKSKQVTLRSVSASPIWTAFHRVYAVWRAPHRIRVKALFAIPTFDSEPDSTAAALRTCIEQAARLLLEQPLREEVSESSLRSQLDLLVSTGKISRRLASLMHSVRRLGNKAIHGANADFESVLRDFPEILEELWPDR